MTTSLSASEVEQVLTAYLKKRYKFDKIKFTSEFKEVMFETTDKQSTRGGHKVPNHGLIKFLQIRLTATRTMRELHRDANTFGVFDYPEYDYFRMSVHKAIEKNPNKFRWIKFLSEGTDMETISVNPPLTERMRKTLVH